MALALGENRDKHVGSRHLFPSRGLDMDNGTLDDPLEAGGRLGILLATRDEVFQLGLDIVDKIAAQEIEVNAAGAHHGCRVLIINQRQQQVLKRRIFLLPLVGEGQSLMQGFFEASGE